MEERIFISLTRDELRHIIIEAITMSRDKNIKVSNDIETISEWMLRKDVSPRLSNVLNSVVRDDQHRGDPETLISSVGTGFLRKLRNSGMKSINEFKELREQDGVKV